MLLVTEGFEDWQGLDTEGPLYAPWPMNVSTSNAGTTTGTDTGTARFISNVDSNVLFLDFFLGNQTDLIAGFYYKVSGTAMAGRAICSFRAWDPAANVNYIMGCVTLDSNRLKLSVGNSATNYVAIGSLLSNDTWYHVEVKFVLGATGSMEVRLNGVTDCAAVNVNTNHNNMGFISYISFGSSSHTSILDDVIIMNLLGTEFNDWLGPVYIKKLLGVASGSSSDFTVVGTLTTTQLLQQTPRPSTLTNYFEAKKSSDAAPFSMKQYFTHQPLTTNYTVVGVVQAVFHATYGLSPNNSVKAWVKSGVDDQVGGFLSRNVSYTPHWDYVTYAKAPDGGAWTAARLNGAEFGVVVEEL